MTAQPELAPDTFDREMDDVPRRPRSPRAGATLDAQGYVRALANPFLAAAWVVGWLIATRYLILFEHFALNMLALMVLIGITPLLLQYHCLDCGHTGWLFRWRWHSCPQVEARRAARRYRWVRGPTPGFQILIWIALAFLALVLPAIWQLRRFEG